MPRLHPCPARQCAGIVPCRKPTMNLNHLPIFRRWLEYVALLVLAALVYAVWRIAG